MDKFLVNPDIILAIKLLEDSGFEAYIVGGAVRDLILGYTVSDYDIVTNASLDEAIDIFKDYKTKKYISKGMTVGVKINHTYFELSSFKGNSIEEDLLYRDFSINSIAYNINIGLIDPYNGSLDLSNKIIKTVRDESIVLKEDPIRILRAIRFSSTRCLSIDNKLKESMLELKDLLNNVAKERIEKELDSIMLSNKPSIYLREYIDVYSVLFNKLSKCKNFDQKCENWHNLDVLEHILKVIDSTKPDKVLRYAALFHDIAKPDCFTLDLNGVGHFYGHPIKSEEYAKEMLLKYSYNHNFINRVSKLVLFHDYQISNKESSILKFLYNFGTYDIDLFFNLKRADILGQTPNKYDRLYEIDIIEEKVNEVIKNNKIITYKNLNINGDTLKELKYPYDKINKALDHIINKVIDKELKNDKDKLYNYAVLLKDKLDEL